MQTDSWATGWRVGRWAKHALAPSGRARWAPLALLLATLAAPVDAQAQMMRMLGCGSGMGEMMWVMVAFWLLIAILAVLAVVALIKYIFGGQ